MATETLTPEEVIQELRTLRAKIPDYTQMPVPDAQALRRAAHVDPEFARAAINTIGASETVKTAIGRTPEDLRRDDEEITRWAAVEDELRAMLNGVKSANLMRRHRLGITALQTYSISRQLVRTPNAHEDLLPHVDGMKRMKKFSRRRKTAAPPEPQPPKPPTQPQPVPPAKQ